MFTEYFVGKGRLKKGIRILNFEKLPKFSQSLDVKIKAKGFSSFSSSFLLLPLFFTLPTPLHPFPPPLPPFFLYVFSKYL